jgi:zinc transport system ATP-binding protein
MVNPRDGKGNGAAVVFENVSVTMGGVRILESVSAHVPTGGATAIIGPNGAGKTTLLLALLGQVRYEGSIRLAPSRRGGPARVGYVPQRLEFDRGLPMTVMEMLVAGGQRRPLWFGPARRVRQKAEESLAAVKAEHLANRRLGALSGGELQRALLALAMRQDPEVLILDEPAAGVDVEGEHLICELLEKFREERGFTQVMVTHDLSLVTAHSTHVICLNRRVMGEGPTRATLTDETLKATFGIHLGIADLHCGMDLHAHGQADKGTDDA